MDGIQNVWIYKTTEEKKIIYFNESDNQFQGSGIEHNKVNLSGLYDVEIECIDEGLIQ